MSISSLFKNVVAYAVLGMQILLPFPQKASTHASFLDLVPAGKTPEHSYVVTAAAGPDLKKAAKVRAVPVPAPENKRAKAFSKALIAGTYTDQHGHKKNPHKTDHNCVVKLRDAYAAAGVKLSRGYPGTMKESLLHDGFYRIDPKKEKLRVGDCAVIIPHGKIRIGHVSGIADNDGPKQKNAVWAADMIHRRQGADGAWVYAAPINRTKIFYYRSHAFDAPASQDGEYRWAFSSPSYLYTYAARSVTASPYKAPVVRGYCEHVVQKATASASQHIATADKVGKTKVAVASALPNEMQRHWNNAKQAACARDAAHGDRRLYAAASKDLKKSVKHMAAALPKALTNSPAEGAITAGYIVQQYNDKSLYWTSMKAAEKKKIVRLLEKHLDGIAATDKALEQQAVRLIVKNAGSRSERGRALARLSWRLNGPSVS